MKTQRQKHSGVFTAKVAIEALQERESSMSLPANMGFIPT
jgi:hypothetical protein